MALIRSKGRIVESPESEAALTFLPELGGVKRRWNVQVNDFQDEIQERDCGGISASGAATEEAEGHHPVRRDARNAAEAAFDGIPGGKRLLGLLSAIPGSMGERREVPAKVS